MKTFIILLLAVLLFPSISQACEDEVQGANLYWQVRYAETTTEVTRLEIAAKEKPEMYGKFVGGLIANKNISKDFKDEWVSNMSKIAHEKLDALK